MSIEVVKRTALVELTYKELKSMIDPNYLRARERIRQLRKDGTRFDKLRGSSMIFRTYSSNHAKNGIVYEQEVKLLDLPEALKTPNKTLRDRVLQAMRGDVALRCTCPAFVYWGFGYILFFLKSAAAGRTLRPPVARGAKKWPAPVKKRPGYYPTQPHRRRNWELRGVMCKHLGLVMEVLGSHWTSVVRELKSQGYE